MTSFSSMARVRIVTALLGAMLSSADAMGQVAINYYPDADEEAPVAKKAAGQVLNLPLFAPLFATQEDAQAYWDLSLDAFSAPAPSARAVAKAFLKHHMDVDGDALVVAHFPSGEARLQGKPDHQMSLTEALMEAFPEHSRHTLFAWAADGVEGLMTGGEASPGLIAFAEDLVHGGNAGTLFKKVGSFLWSRTIGGYIQNTFFARGNVRETTNEDARPLDEAFGIYLKGGGFMPGNASQLRLSQLVEKLGAPGAFAELPYVNELNVALDSYWRAHRSAWPVVARYRFVGEAREAHASGVLDWKQFERVMRAGARHVPLEGPITMEQLRQAAPAGVRVRRFDINGYASNDIVRFVAADGSEVMYIPGSERPFMAFRDEKALRQWVVAQTKNAESLHALLSHFSIYNNQDGTFWTGAANTLKKIADGVWEADGRSIDHVGQAITGDIFEDMGARTEARMRDDARMQVSTAWEAWRTTIDRTIELLSPLGVVPVVGIPMQVGSGLVGIGTGIEQGIDGRTVEERRAGFGQAMMTAVVTVPLATAFSRMGKGATVKGVKGGSPSFVWPSRVNGRIGYPMGMRRPPRWPSAVNDTPEPRRAFDPLMTPEEEARPAAVYKDPVEQLVVRGYTVAAVPDTEAVRVDKVIALKKTQIDGLRHRLDDFRLEGIVDENGEWPRNIRGYRTANHSIVYRVDARTPSELLAQGEFGVSPRFDALEEMLPGRATIGSGSLSASERVFRGWENSGFAGHDSFNQYAVWAEGREVASASDNLASTQHEADLDEVHFPADIPAKDIFIIDSHDPAVRKAIAAIVESRHVSTPYGVPLEAFEKYVAGRLNIDAPNEFSDVR